MLVVLKILKGSLFFMNFIEYRFRFETLVDVNQFIGALPSSRSVTRFRSFLITQNSLWRR